MWTAIAVTALAVVCSIGSFVCFIIVVARMFRYDQAGVAWASIILTFITGFGPLIAMVIGCIKWTEWQLSKVMTAWLTCFVVGTIATAGAAFLWINLIFNAVDKLAEEDGDGRNLAEKKVAEWLGDAKKDVNPWVDTAADDEAAKAMKATDWIDEELSYEQIEVHEKAVDESHLDARLSDQLDSDKTTFAQFVELLKHEKPAVRLRAARKLRYRSERIEDDRPAVIAGLSETLFDDNLIVRRESAAAIAAFEKDAALATAALIKTLRSRDGTLAASAATALANIGPDAKEAIPDLIEEIRRGRYWTGSESARALAAMGPDAKPAVPLIAKRIEENVEFGRALGTLGAKDELLAAYKDESGSKRKSAVAGLSQLRPTTVEIVELLGAALKDKEEWVRTQAAEELGNIEPKLPEAMPYLTAAVSSKEEDVRRNATRSLSKFKIDPKTRLLAILPQLSDEDDYARHNAESAIKKTGADAIPILIGLIDDKSNTANIRGNATSALYGLASIKDDKATVAAALKQLASDPQEHIDVRSAAALVIDRSYYGDDALDEKVRDPIFIEAVSKSSNPATRKLAISRIESRRIKAGVPAVIAALDDESKVVVNQAASMLGTMHSEETPIAKEAVDPLIKTLKERKSKYRSTVVRSLGKFGPEAVAAVPELLIVLNTEEGDEYSLHRVAVWSLAQIQVDSPRLPGALAMYLRNKDSSIRKQAAESLGELGAKAKSQTTPLVVALRDKDSSVRQYAAQALGNIGADPKIAAIPLMQLLADESDSVRRAALSAMAQVRPPVAQALPKIVPLLSSTDEYTRREAAKLLAAYGAEAKPALANLIKALDDPEDVVRKHAADALSKMGPDAKPAIPKLIERFGASEYSWSEERRNSAIALLGFVTTEPTVRKWFDAALKNDKDRGTIQQALNALKEGALPLVTTLLEDDDAALRLSTVQLLSRVGDAKAFVPLFKKALKDEDSLVQGAAALALSKLDVEFDKSILIPAHIAGLSSINRDDVNAARNFLYPLKRKAVPALAAVIADESASTAARKAAMNFVSDISSYSRKAVPSLEKALKSSESEVRFAAAFSLSIIDPKKCPVDVLVEGMQQDNIDIRSSAIDASHSIVGLDKEKTKKLVPVLIGLLKHKDRGTRYSAGEVLANIDIDASHVPSVLEAMKDPETQAPAVLALASLREKPEPVILELVSALSAEDQSAARSAGRQLTAAKEAAVPHLIKVVKSKDAPANARARACEALGNMRDDGRTAGKALIGALEDDDPKVRLQAAVAIGRMGGANKASLKLLLDGLKSKQYNEYQNCFDALVAAKKRAKPAAEQLIEMLSDENERVRRSAASLVAQVAEPDVAVNALLKAAAERDQKRSYNEILSALAQVGSPLVGSLTKALEQSDPETQLRILSVFGQMGNRAAEASPAMLKLIGSDNEAVAARAATEVTFVDPKAAAAVPKLLEALKSEDRNTVNRALTALSNLGEASKPAAPTLIEMLKKKQRVYNVLNVISSLGPAAKDAVPTLIEMVDKKMYTAGAIRALGQIGPPAADAVPVLVKALDDEKLRYEVSVALGKIGGNAKQAVPILLAEFDDEFSRYDAARALGRMKESAADAVSRLATALASDDAEFREAAASALAELGETAAPAVPQLVTALDNPELTRLAANALGQIGEKSKPAVPKLIAMMKTTKPVDNRIVAIRAIGRIGPAASDAVPELIKALTDDHLRYAATYALGNMGSSAESAVPALIRSINEEEPSSAAIYALGQLGPTAKSAEPHLKKLLDHKNEHTRRSAAEALRKIRGEKDQTETKSSWLRDVRPRRFSLEFATAVDQHRGFPAAA